MCWANYLNNGTRGSIKIPSITIYIFLKKKGENTILVPTFWGHNQFGFYILVAVSLVSVIFKLQSIWSLPLTH